MQKMALPNKIKKLSLFAELFFLSEIVKKFRFQLDLKVQNYRLRFILNNDSR